MSHTYADLMELLKAAEPVPDESAGAGPEVVHSKTLETPMETVAVDEADDDPHRLARVNLQHYATRTGGRTLRYWRDEWYTWGGNRYQKSSDREFRAKVTMAVKEEFDRLYHRELAAADAATRDGQDVPQARK